MDYSIFGSNINNDNNDLLLKLQNNTSNIKIDIHNTEHNFTLNYESSNQHSIIYNKLGLETIINVDSNNYIHNKIENSCNVVIEGQYWKEQHNLNSIYVTSLRKSDLLSKELDVLYSKYLFDTFDGIDGDYYKYSPSSELLDVTEYNLLSEYRFIDTDLKTITTSDIKGVLIHITFNNKHNVTSYQFNKEDTDSVFPHNVAFYHVINKSAYNVYNTTFKTYESFDIKYDLPNNIVSDEFIIHIKDVLIKKDYFNLETDYIYAVTGRVQTDELERINVYNEFETSNYKLAVAFKGITLYTTNTKVFKEYDIDMVEHSIQNVDTLSLKQLVLNDIIYTNIVSSDTIFSSINDIITNEDSIRATIVQGYLDSRSVDIENLVQVFNPDFITAITTNTSDETCNSNKYIPYVYINGNDGISDIIKMEYDCNVNIKYLLNLEDLDISDKIMKHSNGIIYKENKLDNLIISSNLTVSNNIDVSGNITINSNILKWDNDIDKFTHSDGKIIQDNVLDMIRYDPIIKNATISFDKTYDAFTLGFSNNDKPYYIRHPYNFVNTVFANEAGIHNKYINSMYTIDNGPECNLKIQFLHLIEEFNLYISSRYGNFYNNSIKVDFVDRKNDPQVIEDSRPNQLYYMSNDQSNLYLDYYEYELPEKVLLKSISFYDIHFKDYSNLLNEYYDNIIPILSDETQNIYTYPNKNYLNHFDIIGCNVNWELIQHVSVNTIETTNQYKINKINSNKKYSKYRIVFKNSDDKTLPYIIKDLKFHVEYSESNNNLIYNGEYVNFNIENFSINNTTRWYTSNNIRTKFIINEDLLSINDFYDVAASTNPYAVCHINETIDNTKLLNNHMLKFGLLNNDAELPDVEYDSYSLKKDTPSVYHSLHLMNNNVYYTLSIVNKLYNLYNGQGNEFLTLVENINIKNENGIISVNILKECLSNMINSTDSNISNVTGLVVNPSIRLCSFDNNNVKSYIDIGINSNLTLDNSYRIELPTNSCNITTDETYYLRPEANHLNKTIKTEWIPLGEEIFQKPNIYIGKHGNRKIDISEYCNINPNDDTSIPENLIHIRKLFIGYPELASNIEEINKNVLTVGGSVYASHDVSTDSDISYKYNLEKIQDVRYKVEQLNGYTFDRNDTNEKRRFSGLIAQDVEKVLPEVIIKKHDGKLRVLYNNLAGLFVECFKDLYKEIDELKKEVRNHKVAQ